MRDFWSFLLQTLTASGAAALLLAVKALFRDKLSPRWQFAIWGVLGIVLLLPAGLGGRYVLVNWPFAVEALRSLLTGEYGVLTYVSAPVPLLPGAPPETVGDWLFVIYLAGAALLLCRYAVSYLRLRLALRRGRPGDSLRVQAAAEAHGLPACPAVEVPGLSSAFICGVLRPVLALPEGGQADGKVILHELLHLKHHDAAWGMVICFFRCLHWCNPLLWYCADRAGNDLESLCDWRVLERLEGEDRRDYGRILLSMASERYARVPGTSSMANGGKNIRRRIEAIVRFKKYPAGMALVSVCMALLLAAPLAVGAQAGTVRQGGGLLANIPAAMASARTTGCTTYAGALDTYAKAVLDGNVLYRAMCAPLAEQAGLAEELRLSQQISVWPPDSEWNSGLPKPAYVHGGYKIYNLTPAGEDAWEGLVVVQLSEPPEGESWNEWGYCWLAAQSVRAEKEGRRWVVRPLEDFRCFDPARDPDWGSQDNLPAFLYEAQAGDFTVQIAYQTTCNVDSYQQTNDWFFSSRTFRTTPQPHGVFSSARYSIDTYAVYTGDPEKREEIESLGVSVAPMSLDGPRPALHAPGMDNSTGASSDGADWGSKTDLGWERNGGRIWLSGGGGGGSGGSGGWQYNPPECYAADFYVNGSLAAELTLLPAEGGAYG